MAAIDFPVATAPDQEFLAGTTTYIWNGQGWLAGRTTSSGGGGGGGEGTPVDAYTKAESDAINAAQDAANTAQNADINNRVLRSGDTISGSLIVNGTTTSLGRLASPNIAVTSAAGMEFTDGIATRWMLRAENAASGSFFFHRYGADGGYLGSPMSINGANGDLSVSGVIYTPSTMSCGSFYCSGPATYAGALGANTLQASYGGAMAIYTPGEMSCGYFYTAGTGRFGGHLTAPSAAIDNDLGCRNVTVTSGGAVHLQSGNGVRQCIFNVQDSGQMTWANPNHANGVMWLSHNGVLNPSAFAVKNAGYGSAETGENYCWGWNAGSLSAWIGTTKVGNVMLVSDYRVKKDVIDLPGMWETVKGLRPIKYTHADYTPLAETATYSELGRPCIAGDDVERWGFIAHELQQTLTMSAASGFKDAPNEIQSPDLAPVVAALTKALQEAMARIETLEAAVTPTNAKRT